MKQLKKNKTLGSAIFLLLLSFTSNSQHSNQMRYEDKIRIREAKIINEKYGNLIWEGINEVPFTILLITDSLEFLIDHPNPTSDFEPLGFDTILDSEVYSRPRKFQTSFLATFPAVNGINCVVVGTPENTSKSSSEWIITLLHEHFHQYQYNQPDYYQSVNNLNLSNGDQTGMWMLNYPFPYDNLKIISEFNTYAKNLSQIISSTSNNWSENLKDYLTARKSLMNSLDSSDYKYLSFQLWQEGIARYTEYKFLELMENHESTEAVNSLADFEPFSKLKSDMLTIEIENITRLKIDEVKRVCFYAIGMAEGLILDKLNSAWRNDYFANKFFIENYSNHFHKQ